MILFLTNLWEAFGIVGILSVIVWIESLVVLIASANREQRTRRRWMALGIAIVGLLLARWNSHRVSEIRYDQSDEIAAGRELGQSLTTNAVATNVTSELADPGIISTNEVDESRKYAYRTGGKVERETGKQKAREVAGIEVREEEKPLYRTMKARDLHRANHYDKVNLFSVRFLIWLTSIMILVDYLRRLNTTFEAYCPLPFTGPWLDAVFPKTRTLSLVGSARNRIEECLEYAVLKGDTFVYFGSADPWERDALPRIVVRGREFWPLKKICCRTDGEPFTSTYVFESAWFGRYCFVVEGLDLSRQWLADLERFLVRRQAVRAYSRRSVHVVWDFDEPIPTNRLEEFIVHCRETNYKLVVTSPTPTTTEFDEVVEG